MSTNEHMKNTQDDQKQDRSICLVEERCWQRDVRNVKLLQKDLIINPKLGTSKLLILFMNFTHAPVLQLPEAPNKTTSAVLNVTRKT